MRRPLPRWPTLRCVPAEVQVEEIAAAQLRGLDAVVDDRPRNPAHPAAVRQRATVDLGVLAADVGLAHASGRA